MVIFKTSRNFPSFPDCKCPVINNMLVKILLQSVTIIQLLLYSYFYFYFVYSKDLKEACCKDVLIYVAEQLDDNNWHQFLMILTNDKNLIEEMQRNGKSAKENVMDFFESITFQLKWTDLEETLHTMEKSSILDDIKNTFLYTRGKIIFVNLKHSIIFFLEFLKNKIILENITNTTSSYFF